MIVETGEAHVLLQRLDEPDVAFGAGERDDVLKAGEADQQARRRRGLDGRRAAALARARPNAPGGAARPNAGVAPASGRRAEAAGRRGEAGIANSASLRSASSGVGRSEA